MKIQCDVCEKAEAAVFCCADEAALCWGCDEKVHAANKLAGKHQRVQLLHPTAASGLPKMPTCDICQEKFGYFFCLEDRALLCRHCDVSIHSSSSLASHHQRFLIAGVRISLHHPAGTGDSSSSLVADGLSNCSGSLARSDDRSASLGSNDSKKFLKALARLGGEKGESLRSKWPWKELFKGSEFDYSYGISDPGSSS
ncbi:hypothetical protein HPP92_004109 [Vanilla planifolia]|nr:hypothetical protein HPP92_004109 [Vanilla planifolia]